MDDRQSDMCRVCRSEGSSEKPLYHPCVCTGSIKYIHQECLVQWLKYSKKEYCELCKHRYTFTPIYAPDMPKRLPLQDIMSGLLRSVGRAVRFWLHYTLVAIAWLGIVPLTACRIYRCLFTGSVSSLLTLPLDMLSTENLLSDCFQGCFVVTCTLCTFISLVWLREQILHGGGPDWLEQDLHAPPNAPQNANAAPNNAGAAAAAAGADEVNEVAPEPAVAEGGVNAEAAADAEDDDGDDELADNEDNGNAGNNDENNWNPIEWERAAEELTWERLLGLDGSLLFMEHVFWVVSLNTLFIMLFAFCPYHIGQFTVAGLKAQEAFSATKFEGLLTTLLGYLIIASSLALLHFATNLVDFKRSKRILGLCYIAIKVSLLVVMEIVLFPLVCGWWLDICSLSMFDATLKDREHSFQVAPGTSMFIHWLVGMVYIFYFASFILLLREVLRPGVLWFLRNLNDPDFNPIQEMIHLPVYRHIRRFVASMVVFGTIVLVMLWLPIQVIQRLFPLFLPFHVMLSSPDTPVSELSLELLLLQVVLPALLEQGHTRQWLKGIIRGWCIAVAWLLNLRSYLLGDVALAEDAPNAAEDVLVDAVAEDLVAPHVEEDAHQPPLATDGISGPEAADVPVVAPDEPSGMTQDEEAEQGDLPQGEIRGGSEAGKVESGESEDEDLRRMKMLKGENRGKEACYEMANKSKGELEIPTDEVAETRDGVDALLGNLVGQPVQLEKPAVELPIFKSRIGAELLVDLAASESKLLDDRDGEPALQDNRHREPDKQDDNGREPAEEISEPEQTVNAARELEQPDNIDREPEEQNNAAREPEHLDETAGEHPVLPDNGDMEPVQPDNTAREPEQPLPAFAEAAAPAEANNLPLGPDADAGVAPPVPPRPNRPLQGLGDAHQAMMQGGGPTGFQPYTRPDLFPLRLLLLIVLMCLTLFMASLVLFVLPVFVGRKLMSFWTGEMKVHELYTAACGLYTCWVALRIGLVLYTWIPLGWRAITDKVMEWTLLVSKSVFVAVVLIGILPLLLGLIFELVLVIPIRVPIDQTPVFFPWQDWALGVLHAKILTAITLMGPHWRMKRVIEQVYNQGLRNMDLKFVMIEFCLPVLVFLGLLLALPYIIAKSLVPAVGFGFEMQNLVLRRIYPFLLSIFLLVFFCIFQARQFRRLYEHIKNDKYLVGQRLVNYERRA